MGQYRTPEKVIRQQEMQIQELSHMLALLQEENSLLRELSGQLKKENSLLRRHLEDYAALVHQAVDEAGSAQDTGCYGKAYRDNDQT